MSRTGTKEQDARARAREARLMLLADRNAQDERIEAAVAAALLAWEDRTAAAGKVEEAERDTAAGLALLSREKVPVRDMAALTGIGQSVCSRLLKMPAADEPANGTGGAVPLYQVKIVTVPGRSVCGGAGPSRGEVTDASTSAPWLIPTPALMVLGRVSGSCASSRTGLGTPWCTAHPR